MIGGAVKMVWERMGGESGGDDGVGMVEQWR